MNNLNKVPPFKGWVIQNFPFIEADFDAITEYQLLCKVVEYLNKVIANENQLSESMNYVLNYFNNLDVQEEIDNKLDEMAESGELTEIIAQYLQLAGLLCFNTKNDMKAAQNLVNGSFVKTFGTTTYKDGYGQFYKIRTLTSSDTIDNVNIIALTHYPTLIAELIHNKTLDDIVTEVGTYTNRISNLESNNMSELVVVGDSYTFWEESLWAEEVAGQLHLNLHKIGRGGIGFSFNTNHQSDNFLYYLNHYTITESDRLHTKYFIVYGGVNDLSADRTTEKANVIAFFTRAKELYPNANFLMIGPQSFYDNHASNSYETLIKAIKEGALESEVAYINPYSWLWSCGYARNDVYIEDHNHPTVLGHKIIASKIMNCINSLNNEYAIKVTTVDTFADSTSVRVSMNPHHCHIEGRINGQTWAANTRVRILNLDTNSTYFLNRGSHIGDVYKFNGTYIHSQGYLGSLTLTNNNDGLQVYNNTGSDWTGDIIFKLDLYDNLINII